MRRANCVRKGRGSAERAGYEAPIRPSPGGSHLGGPLGGVLHHRLAEAVIHVGRHCPPRAGPAPLGALVSLLPPQRSRCLRPARSTRPPKAKKPNRGDGGGGARGGVASLGPAAGRVPAGTRRPGTPLLPPLARRWSGEGFLARPIPSGPGSTRLPKLHRDGGGSSGPRRACYF